MRIETPAISERCIGMRKNLRLFIAFRVLFNARFYYPVLGVLFLDLGLSLEQYALLNVVWAVTILVLEVPSGALADLVGRRSLVVSAACLMVLEMAVFAFAPLGGWLFPMLLLNRVLSGMAEACASGADEALAYDSLPLEDREAQWRDVLARLVKWSSGTFFVAMILGALAFDPDVAASLLRVLGWGGVEPVTTRWPVYMTLVMSLGALGCALAMREPPRSQEPQSQNSWRGAFDNIMAGAKMVISNPKIRLLLLCAVLFDSLVRIFLTFASNYYRLVELPEFVNGFMGSSYALLGFLAAGLARKIAARHGAGFAFALVGGLVFLGLVGLVPATRYWGVWVILPFGIGMPMMKYFLSNYLNAWTDSSLRATVLSFRGVAVNLGYAMAGLGFAGFTASLRGRFPELSSTDLFAKSLVCLPAAFLLGGLVLLPFLKTVRRAS